MYNPKLDKAKDNKFFIELYPSAENYDCYQLIESLNLMAVKHASILHDSDVILDDNGEVLDYKKPHIHYYLKTATMRSRKAIAEDIGLPINYIQYALSERSAIRYLIHADDLTKHQYDYSLIDSDFDFTKYLVDSEELEVMHIKMLMDFVKNTPRCTMSDLMRFALDNGCYKDLRKSSYLFTQLLKTA